MIGFRAVGAALVFLSCLSATAHPAGKTGTHYALLINGGGNRTSNSERFLNNIAAFHAALRGRGLPPGNITVLYGSGKLEDTNFDPGDLDLNEYVFGDGSLRPDGPATSRAVVENLNRIRAKIGRTGGDLLVFITGLGTRKKEGGSPGIELWGESMPVARMGELLEAFPPAVKIRIVTNISYGGAMTSLTGPRLCVFANQSSDRDSVSETRDLDLYGQNFPYGLREAGDLDGDGKRTLMDAHLYASETDNPKNIAYSSLDRFLDINRDWILSWKKEHTKGYRPPAPISPPDRNFRRLTGIIAAFDEFDLEAMISTDGIPPDRKPFLKGRLERKFERMRGEKAFSRSSALAARVREWKPAISRSAAEWGRLSDRDKIARSQRANLDGQMLEGYFEELRPAIAPLVRTRLELDLLEYGGHRLLKEYRKVRECLEEAY